MWLRGGQNGRQCLPPPFHAPSQSAVEQLIERCLRQQLLWGGASTRTFSKYIESDWLEILAAKAKLTSGEHAGQQQQLTEFLQSKLGSDAVQQLTSTSNSWAVQVMWFNFDATEAVTIEFQPHVREEFAVADAVTLPLELKNVPELMVNVFEINTTTYYRVCPAYRLHNHNS